MYCPNCGSKISDTSKFCGKCGQRLLEGNSFENLPKGSSPYKISVQTGVPPKPVTYIGFAVSIIAVVCMIIALTEYSPYSLHGSALVGVCCSGIAIVMCGLSMKNKRMRGLAAAGLAIGIGTFGIFIILIALFASAAAEFYSRGYVIERYFS